MKSKDNVAFRTTLIQRLGARLLRLQGYSTSQTGAMIGTSPTSVLAICRGITQENLLDATLSEIGSPVGPEVYNHLLVAAQVYVTDRIEHVRPGAPRGQASMPLEMAA